MTISKLQEYCNKPYDLIESKKFRYLFVLGMGVFVFFFLWVFEPFGLENLKDDEKFSVIGIYAGTSLLLAALQFLVVQNLIFKNYKVCNTFMWLLLHLVLIGLSNGLINSYLWNDGYISLYYVLYFQWVVFSIGFFPIALFITLHYAWLMKRRAEKALAVNARITEKQKRTTDISETPVSLKAYNGKNAFIGTINRVVMIASAENYVEVHFIEKESVQKELIRNTLSNIEKQLAHHQVFIRCHKSYIVNKQFVKKIKGNAAGYKLQLRTANYEIPVSRSLNSKIKSVF